MPKLHDILFHDMKTFSIIFTVKARKGKDRVGTSHVTRTDVAFFHQVKDSSTYLSS